MQSVFDDNERRSDQALVCRRSANDFSGNLPSMPGNFPDYPAPVVRSAEAGRQLTLARWGMPSSQLALMQVTKKRAEKLEAKGKVVDFKELLRMEPDGGTTNIPNVASKHWRRWLGPSNRCVVPFTSFSEFNRDASGDIWFALEESRPLACFAGMWTNWTSVRKFREGETTDDLFAFLTTEPNAEVGAVHPKAMPVILTSLEEAAEYVLPMLDFDGGLDPMKCNQSSGRGYILHAELNRTNQADGQV